MHGDPRIREPALDPGGDLGRGQHQGVGTIVLQTVVDLPVPLVLSQNALDDRQAAGDRGLPGEGQGRGGNNGQSREEGRGKRPGA
jgi:hypothetical protein